MQSSSSSTVSTLGLLACAAVAGMFAAKKWPQGPPRDLPLRAGDWLLGQMAPPMAKSEARDYGPAPPFGAPEIKPGDPRDRLEPPAVVVPQPPPPGASPPPQASQPPGDVAPPFHWAGSGPDRKPDPVPRRPEPPAPGPFWSTDLHELLPGLGGSGPSTDAKDAASVMTSSKGPPLGPSAAAEGPGSDGTIERLVRRLEQMGAVVVRLERRPGAAAGYLFHCELPLNARYHRFFDAVDADPARAIQRVTRDVEAWKATSRR